MIKKERLEELIEQGATVWRSMCGDIHKIRLDKRYFFCDDNKLCWHTIAKLMPRLFVDFEYLFETKEDAEEFAEFGEIAITVTLKLPNWNEVPEYQDKTYYNLAIFKNRNNDCYCDFYIKYDTPNYSRIMITNGCVELFNKPLTRENYDDARRLCVKLFKGE